MTNEELLKVIERAKIIGVKKLDLSGNQLTVLPPEIGLLRNLQKLNLRDNKLTTLPPEIGQLISLIRLDLSGNQLATLPPELCQLRNLQELNLRDNKLTALPPEVGQLRNLQELNLLDNKLTALPPKLFQSTHLRVLTLSVNQLTTLPPELSNLTKLERLFVACNRLTTLPPEICQLSNLNYLSVIDNPLVSPPPEIAKKGIEAIRRYFAELEKSKQPLNEVKVLLIGDGAAGKTSLVKQLFGQPFDKNEDTTHGISIRGREQEVGGRQITINLWDFGGQETQHATHQFFLSKRSLYVLVLDGRKDERTEYWLRHVEAFGGSSPVLIVLNKIDSNPSFDLNRPFLLEKYPGIRDFFRISCKSGKGVAEFKAALLAELNKVEMIGTVWPGSWFAVKHRLEQMDRPYISAAEYGGFCKKAGITAEQSRETLVDFLHDLGVVVHFREFLLDAMHVLDPVWVTEAVYKIITAESMAESKGLLRLDALKAILKELPAPRLDRLRTMLRLPCCKRHCFPPETHPYILRLMEKFELCYPVGKDAVHIPQLLPVPEPKLTFEQDGSLRFALHYPDFLPPSVFPRFMVKVHKDIHENTCWRTGVLLEDKRSGAQALVKADVEARRINIWVQGEHPREYLHYLRYILADINSSFEKLKIRELVPMPDAEDITADYATLLEYAKNDIDKYIPTDATKVYSVKELLGLVQPKDKNELVQVTEKMDLKPTEKESFTDWLNELVEPKITVLGITFNLKGFFEKLRAWDKQRQQQSRK